MPNFLGFFFSCLAFTSVEGFAPGISGDLNPVGFSVVNLDVDTIEGPIGVKPSVIGYVNSFESMYFIDPCIHC